MTTAEINIAIAEACGKCLHKNTSYAADLNAIHEAERHLATTDPAAKGLYADWLCRVCCKDLTIDEGPSFNEVFQFSTATALQRCEAFLRTLNLWRES